jgi:uncharacterized Fe-S cluster-containing protein
MALIISSVTIKNTDIILENVYARLSFTALANGKHNSVSLSIYKDKENFKKQLHIITDVESSFIVECLPTQTQTIEVIHDLAKEYLEAKDYVVTIQL